MKRVLDNCRILYGEEFEEVRGYIILEEGVIKEVGEGSYLGPKEDVKGGIIAPCFTNAHIHIGDSAGMDLGAYKTIGKRVGKGGLKYDLYRRGDARTAIKSALFDMRRTGTSAFCDFREGGIKGIEQLKSVLDMQARILGRPDGDKDVMMHCDGLGISSIRDYGIDELKSLLEQRKGKIIGIHAGETVDDLEEALKIEPDLVVHLTNAREDSLDKVFERDIPIVLCPRANASFGVGIPDLKRILESGSLVAMGTDNVMANSPNMLREMEFLFKLFRGLYKDIGFDARRVLKIASINGRIALGLPENSIKEGNHADFMITRGVKYSTDPVLALVHRIEADDIKELICPSVPQARY